MQSTLYQAASQGDVVLLRMSLQRNPQLANELNSTTQYTLLSTAARVGQADVIRYLVDEARADINAGDGVTRYTPLHIAAKQGHFTIVNYLLQRGANPQLKSNTGELPIDLVVKKVTGKTLEMERNCRDLLERAMASRVQQPQQLNANGSCISATMSQPLPDCGVQSANDEHSSSDIDHCRTAADGD